MYFSENDIASFPNVVFKLIKTEIRQNLFVITLNRPEKRNAFTPTMVNEIAFALAFANSKSEIWCVLLEAEGPVFCAGMDLNVFQNPELDKVNESLPRPLKEINLGDTFKNFYKPCIAKVKGDVLAGGFLLIGGCTFVIATEKVNFSLPEVLRGIFPLQVMGTLLKIMPPRKALEMCILGKKYTAREALELGLVSQVSSVDGIDDNTENLIQTIISGSPFAVKKGIEAYQRLSDIPESQQYQYLLGLLQEIRNSEDAKEGIKAFNEKRKPTWRNQ
ncbi:enoyl-CoA hydratase/isomerase family protein [Emticicia sp. BO119]|uniref:enoyl-CoA hydratase/isomerase family protein n=1 Tax=Emticicia sp. BO119 TaxID=2757768 RepID=UPI0015F0D3D2|nr:enoyl-CoA hydratase-related protein [Emticicia sp. BO119]MBA4853533.1 enoyl-CoA hydratase/isomerase family protein [Emticicia sp. BO119]